MTQFFPPSASLRSNRVPPHARILHKPLCAAIVLIISSGAIAAEGVADPLPDDLQSVVVTARRSTEAAKDLPFSIQVLTSETIEQGRLLTVDEALRTVPGVDLNSWGGFNDANIRIRGVGSLYQVSAEDSSVVMSVDGVPLSSRGASLGTMDLERIEVLKGPQGTLFGRNSEAGAINITSRRPTRKAEGYVRIEGGQDGQLMTEGAYGGPLSETVSARVAVRYAGADSNVINSQTGNPVLRPHEKGIRASLLWQPDSATSVLAISEVQDQADKVGMMLLRPYADTPTQDVTPGAFGASNRAGRHSVEINHDVGGTRLTSLTSYATVDFNQRSGADLLIAREVYGMPMEYIRANRAIEALYQQDLRWGSLPGAPVFWVVGANLLKSSRSADLHDLLTGGMNLRDFDTRGNAVYGEASMPLGTSFKLTAGARHTRERKQYKATFSGAMASEDQRSLRDHYNTGRLGISYALTPETNLYATIARGYKSGGFNDSSASVADGMPYKAAKARTLEAGVKMEDRSHRLTINGALFQNRVTDDHMLGYDYVTFATTALNADTKSQGAEVDASWRPNSSWTATAGVIYTDGKIKKDVVGVSGGDVFAGARLPDLAPWSGNLTLSHHQPLSSVAGLDRPALNTRLGYRYVGARASDPQNHFELGSYQKLDLRVSLLAGKAEFSIWADNLLDRRYELYGYYFTPTASAGVPARGRSIGAGASWMF